MRKKAGGKDKWKIILTGTAIKQLEALDAVIRKRIRKFLHERVECAEDPRTLAKHLVDTEDLYRFRVGDYRLIAFIDDGEVKILILAVGHRSRIYKKNP